MIGRTDDSLANNNITNIYIIEFLCHRDYYHIISDRTGSNRIGRRKLIFVLKNCFVSFRFVCFFSIYLSISKIVILREKTNKIVSVVVVVVVVVKCLPGKNNFSSIYWIGLDGFPPRLSASYGLYIYVHEISFYVC